MTLPNIVPVPPPGLTTQPSNGVHQGHATSPGLPSVAVNPNPFAGIPVRDYVLDAVSALLLVVSLFMVWHYQGSTTNVVRASSNIAVLLLTILSLLSLGLTYLWRAGAFGPTWNYRKMQDLRMAANIPYLVLFLVSLVMILLEGSSSGLAGAMGQAAAFGLAGALLAAQPRKAELTERSEDAGRDRRWIFILFGVVALALLLGFVQFIKMLVSLDGSGDWFLVGSISTGLLSLYLMVELVRRIHAKNESARLLAVGLGLAGTFMVLVSLGNPWQASSTIYGDEFVFSAFMWLPFGAIAAAPSIARQMLPMDSKAKWLRTIHLALNLTLVIAAVSLLTTVGNLIEIRSFAQGAMMAQLVLTLLFSVVLGVGALVVRQSFTANPTQAYTLTSAFAGIIFVLFLILVIMASANDFSTGWMAGLLLLITFVIPAALLGLLWAPSSTRAGYSALKGKAQMKRGFSFDGTSGHAVPQPVEGTVEAGIEQLLAEASSAGTAPLRLRELALNHPQTRDAIIANPVTYAELRDWLVQLRNNLPAPEPSAEEAIEPLLVEASDPATSGVRLQELAGAHPELHEAILANPAAYAGLCN